jgi:tRNA dimethylallyltransferase
VLVVLGPTGVGKSEFALLACQRFGGEILSVDAMQVYRGLDRGTAKPDAGARRLVPHHGLDLADPGRDFSMGDFVRTAESSIEAIRKRGHLPVLVGGTGLYLRGLLKGIIAAPRRDAALRRRLRSLEERRGRGALHRMLARLDPEAAGKLPVGDRQRLVRALEVFFLARRGLSELIQESPFGPDRFPAIKIGLSMDRKRLHQLTDARVVRFFRAGLVEEIRGLLAGGLAPTSNALKALGYREVLRHLEGEISLEEAIAQTQRNTRRYAKRQLTWFRKEEGVTWFEVDPSRADRFREPMEFASRSLVRR